MIGNVVSNWAEATPKAPVFLGHGQRALTYEELARLIADFRTQLQHFGLGLQDRIAIVHSGGAEMAATVVGIAASSIAVPLNPDLSAGEFALHLRDKNVGAVAVEKGLDSPVRLVAQELSLPLLEITQEDLQVAGKIALQGPSNPLSTPPPLPTETDLMLVLTTSGTTSYGKIVPITHGQVIERARQITQMLELTPKDRGMNLMPLFHVGGLSAGIAAALYSGSSLMPIKNGHVNALFRSLEETLPTYIAGGYTVFHAIERKASAYQDVIDRVKPHIRMLRTGTGHLDREIADHLEQIFEATVVEAYGSSETGFMSCTALTPDRNKSDSVGRPQHTEVSIVDPKGVEMPVGQEGEIVVKGDNVFSGYENDPDQNIAAFSNGFFHTGDQGLLDEDGYLFITGRIKEMINRGGMKITPQEIDQALLSHSAVADAAAIPITHPSLGEDVAAVVNLVEGKSLTAQDLIRYLGDHLAPYKIPNRVFFADSLPRTATGKIQRRELAVQMQAELEASAPRQPTAEPHQLTPLESTLLSIWRESMGNPDIGVQDNFFELGGDSLQAVDLFLLVEKRLDQRLPRDILFEAGSVAEMAALIEQESKASCVVPIQPKGNRPPFFCIHPIGGEVIGYRDLAGYLGEDQPFYGIQCLRQGTDTPLFDSIETMAEYYLAEIRKIQPHGPYFLGGHSFGGLVAYTIAQKLADDGGRVGLLALFDSFNTSVARYVSPVEWLRRHWKKMTALPPQDRPAYVRQRARNLLGLVPNSLSLLSIRIKHQPELSSTQELHSNRRVRENNMLISRKFRPKPFSGDAVLFATELPTSWHGDVHDAWGDLVRGQLTVRPLSGGHLEIMSEPFVRELAQELSLCLQNSQNNEPIADKLAVGGNS